MTTQPDILAALAAPFPPDAISWRVGSTNKDKTQGMALAYIDARDVQDRLDEVCGLDWQVRHPWSVATKLACEIGLRVDGEWLWRGDGAGDSDVEAEKGAFSDSFKRAAVRWGIGRYLYDLKSPWVAIEPMGKSYKIVEGEKAKLRALLARGNPPPPPPAAPKASGHQAPPGGAQKPLADFVKEEAAAILAGIRAPDTIDKLDLFMDDTMLRRQKLPDVTQQFLSKTYMQRREAMVGVS